MASIVALLSTHVYPATRPVPMTQRTGGPLPLSVQNEVDAALERGRRGLLKGLRRSTVPLDVLAKCWSLIALLDVTDPRMLDERDSLRDAWRVPPSTGQTVLTSIKDIEIRLALDTLIEAIKPGETTDPEHGRRHLQTLEQALQAVLVVTEPTADDAPIGNPLTVAQLLLDAAPLAGIDTEKDIGERLLSNLKHHLEGLLEASAESVHTPVKALDEVPLLLLRLAIEGADPPIERYITAAERVASQNVFEVALDTGIRGRYLAWLTARLFNTTSPTTMAEHAEDSPPIDWRLYLARQLVSAQRIDPVHAAGFWTEKPDNNIGDPETIALTALSLLILAAL